jgi:hypothetical protein
MVYKIIQGKRRKEIEIDVYDFEVITEGGSEITVNSKSPDIELVKKELKEQGIFVKKIKYVRKKKGLIWE